MLRTLSSYQAQAQILRSLLQEPELEIGTADGMQGRENEAVIISLVRSNPTVSTRYGNYLASRTINYYTKLG